MRLGLQRTDASGGTELVGVVPPPAPPAYGDQVRQVNDIFRRLHSRLVSHAERFVDRETAHDAVSETFLKLWRGWSGLSAEQRTDQFIFRAVGNMAFDLRDQSSRFVSLDDAESELRAKVVSESSPPWRGISAPEAIDEALATMTPRRREVFLLVREQGFSYAEVAEQLGVTTATVNAHMVHAWIDIRAAFAAARIPLPVMRTLRLPAPDGDASND